MTIAIYLPYIPFCIALLALVPQGAGLVVQKLSDIHIDGQQLNEVTQTVELLFALRRVLQLLIFGFAYADLAVISSVSSLTKQLSPGIVVKLILVLLTAHLVLALSLIRIRFDCSSMNYTKYAGPYARQVKGRFYLYFFTVFVIIIPAVMTVIAKNLVT